MALDASSLASWEVEDVRQWLKENGFNSYVRLFCDEHKIDGICLVNMIEKELREPPMQIPILGDVKRLWLAIIDLRRASKNRGKPLNFPRDEIYDEFRPADYSDGKILTDSDSDTGSEIFVRLSGVGDKSRTLVSVLYCFLVLIITSLTMTVVHDRVPDMDRYPPLPDIFLDNMPLIPWAFYICELCASLMSAILIALIVMHKHRLILIRRICAIVGTVFLLRCVTMFLTSMSVPGVHLECSGKIYGDWPTRLKRALTIFFGGGMALNGVRSCGDYMYSGHTCAVTLLNFFISEYSPKRWHFLHTICWLLNIFGIFFILAAHEHYSIDVFIAFYISSRLFLYYHALASSQSLSHRAQLKSRNWFPLFWFFENSCKFRGKVPNEYEWPISLPFWNKKNN